MAVEGGSVLACGTTVESLIEQVADGVPPARPQHQASCPYCQEALAALRDGWRTVAVAARQPVVVPPGLAQRVMWRVRALAARWAEAAVLVGRRGETRIAGWVIARLASRWAAAVPGVAWAGVTEVVISPDAGDRVRIRLRIAISFGPPAEAVAAAVRDAIALRLTRMSGLTAEAIHILVEDVIPGS